MIQMKYFILKGGYCYSKLARDNEILLLVRKWFQIKANSERG